ncbi:hypothetical protein CANARDRAFT_220415 [[Candida] arabinofermentans NRRL YB-2248]|uniref:Ammonium transporter AmtB-like domain-containing protein n=1 Tax=[Candida] arabinofermentans NRRL YB-2248 TaxID=983967 RepID=A0A1E4T298_9ASCO|nr:hypothetical protein CANARDRAFT_220415 [[Candida] arabinofermentans NRRL YB-2248]
MGGYANSGLGSAVLIAAAKRDLSTLSEETSTFVAADMGYVMFCTVGVMILTPAIGLFYGGALKRKNIIQILFQSYMVTATITLQWFLFGYSLAVSPSASSVMGNFKLGALQNIGAGPFVEGGTIPSIIYFTFSAFFPIATVQIFVGAIAERARIIPSLVVGFVWCTVVYCPLAYSTWCANGWLYKLGSLDFAGGGPVHIASGLASLSFSWFVGPRKNWKDPKAGKDYRPENPVATFIGVSIIWCTWLCFNSGTLLAVNTRTGYIMANTQIAASAASFTFTVVDYCYTGKWSLIAACEGAVTGLVNITPSCGFYSPYWAMITSMIVAACCRVVYESNEWLGIDDTTRSFVVHGVGGIIGSMCLGVFASPYIAGLDGVTEIPGGWIFHHWKQMGYQFAGFVSIVVWSFGATYAICFIVDKIPGCKLKGIEEAEEMGMDFYEMAEYDGHTFEDIARMVRKGSDVSYSPEIIEGTSGTVSSSEYHESKAHSHPTKTEEIV